MAEAERIGLARECWVFARHITGAVPSDYVITCYGKAHAADALDAPAGSDALDALLVSAATRTRLLTPLADIYARMFRRAGPLRRKLVLLAAILESTGTTQHAFEPTRSGRVSSFAELLMRGGLFLIQASAALLLFAPAHAVLRLTGRTASRNSVLADVQG